MLDCSNFCLVSGEKYLRSFENIKEDELNLLKRGMDIGEIEDKYYKLVEQNDILFKQNKMEINNLIAKKKERQQYKEEIISKLFEIRI